MLKYDTIWYRSNLQFAISALQYVIFFNLLVQVFRVSFKFMPGICHFSFVAVK